MSLPAWQLPGPTPGHLVAHLHPGEQIPSLTWFSWVSSLAGLTWLSWVSSLAQNKCNYSLDTVSIVR